MYSKNNKKTIQEKQSTCFYINSFLLFLIVLFSGVYIFQVTSFSSKGYEIREVEKSLDGLREKQAKLELELVNLRSLNTIQKKAEDLDLSEVDGIEYLQIKTTSMAKN